MGPSTFTAGAAAAHVATPPRFAAPASRYPSLGLGSVESLQHYDQLPQSRQWARQQWARQRGRRAASPGWCSATRPEGDYTAPLSQRTDTGATAYIQFYSVHAQRGQWYMGCSVQGGRPPAGAGNTSGRAPWQGCTRRCGSPKFRQYISVHRASEVHTSRGRLARASQRLSGLPGRAGRTVAAAFSPGRGPLHHQLWVSGVRPGVRAPLPSAAR